MGKSAAVLQADVAAKRTALQSSVGELRARLAPENLGTEFGTQATARIAQVGSAVGDRAATPAGVVALCGMAFATAFAAGGGLKKARAPQVTLPATTPVRSYSTPASSRAEIGSMLLQASAAVAAGVVLSRFIPETETERTLLDGIGPELRAGARNWISEQAQSMVSPSSARYGLPNMLGLVAALVVSRKNGSDAI